MTSHVVRLYALATAVLVFFLTWAVVAAHPWPAKPDPRAAALVKREQRVRAEALAVRRIVNKRWADYRRAVARRSTQSVATGPPRVRIVNLPPLTVTRTS